MKKLILLILLIGSFAPRGSAQTYDGYCCLLDGTGFPINEPSDWLACIFFSGGTQVASQADCQQTFFCCPDGSCTPASSPFPPFVCGTSGFTLVTDCAACGTQPVCGNGVVDAGEDCDDGGESANCDCDCTFAVMGDGTVNTTAGEVCDDGNTIAGDGCDALGQIEPGFQCETIFSCTGPIPSVCNPIPGCNDEILFTISRATDILGVAINNATSASAAGQIFEGFPGTNINGTRFYAYVADDGAGNPVPVTVTVSIVPVGPDSLPSGPALGSTTFTVDNLIGGGTLGGLVQTVSFSTPIAVNGDYMVVIENNSPAIFFLVSSDYTAGDGQGDYLANVLLGSGWVRSFNINVGGIPFDADWLINPFINYLPMVDLAPDPATGTVGIPIDFMNTSSPEFTSEFYNADIPNAWLWAFGDGNTATTEDASNAYAAANNYTSSLTGTIALWTGGTCQDQKQGNVEIICTPPDVSFTAPDLDVCIEDGPISGLGGGTPVGTGAVSFSEPFNDNGANVTIVQETDTDVQFVDYSNMTIGTTPFSIPEAPRQIAGSAATKGILMRANLMDGAAAGVNIIAGNTPINFTGDYTVSFDVYMNVPLPPLPPSPSIVGTTEQLLWGVGTDNSMPIEARYTRNDGTIGTWGWLVGENGYGTEDAAIFEDDTELADLGDTQLGEDVFFNNAFDMPYAPGAPNNAAANSWVRVDIVVLSGTVSVRYNGVEFFNEASAATDGFAMFGYEDPFSSVTDQPDQMWGLFDNFVVSSGAATSFYAGTGVMDDGNGMTFTFDPSASAPAGGNVTVTYTYTDENGCSNSASDNIFVDPVCCELDITCPGGGNGQNVLVNNSFENGAFHDKEGTDDWEPFGSVFTMDEDNPATEDALAQEGRYFLKMFSFSTPFSGIFQDQPVNPGDIVSTSVWIQNAEFDPMLPGCTGFVKIEFLDASNSFISQTESSKLDHTLPQNTWTKLDFELVAPAGAVTARFVVIMQCTNGGAVMFDNASMTISPPAFDLSCIEELPAGPTSVADFEAFGGSVNTSCNPVTVSFNDVPDNGTGCLGDPLTIVRTITISDEVTMESIACLITYIIEDMTPPSITCPADATVECGLSTSPDVTGTATGTDGCGTVTITFSDDFDPACGNTGTIIRTWKATDECGLMTTCQQIITIVDTTPPSITCANDQTVECGMPTDPGATGTATGSDVCSTVTITFSDDFDPACGNTGTISRTWKATDECGLMSTCVQIITIEDTTPPDIIFVPQAVTIACDGSIDPANTGTAIATDICTPNNQIAITFNDVLSGTLCGGQSITRTWTATDLCGQAASADQIITISSPDAPTISCPDLMVVECFSDINTSADNATVTTQCTDPMVSVSPPVLTSGTADCNGAVYTVTYTVTDGCGQTASCTQDFAIVNDGPTIACAADQTVECVEDINPTEADVAVMTACGVDSDIDISEATVFGQDGCSGTVYQFTYTVTDICGRVASCTRSYTLENDGPEIMAPDDETVECASDINVDAADAEVEYACALDGDVEVSGPVQVGDDDCPGTTYTYTYTVTDECGRSASDEQVFTIDNAGPTIASPADQTVECAFDIATDAGAAVVTTSCTLGSSVIISGPVRLGPENCPGTTYTYTYIVTDDCGRTASDDQVFTIGENDGPTIAVVPNITVDCFESINPNPNLADVTTACGNGVDFSLAVTDPVLGSGLNCPGEMYSVTYTITDACGRMASAVQTYTIANEGPAMECPDNCEVLSCYDGDYNHVIDAWLLTVTASSSCSMDLTVSNDYLGLEGICVGDFTPVTFTATDACGRTASCESGIFIVDTDAPDIIGEPSELLVPCTGVTEDIFADWLATRGGVEAYDACYEDDITWSTNPANPMALLDCSNGPQAIVVEFIVTDGCGNSASVNGVFNTKLLPNAVNVAGLIQTEAAEAVSSVEVSAYQSTGMAAMDISDDNGDYNFEELPYEENTEIVPSRDGDYLNGVSTYDLILLQQHILDIQALDSPYKRIAADANRSGTISTLDLVLLRRLILHIDEELADNTSWRFVDADFVFPNPDNPLETDFPETYNLSGEEEELKDFVAVKIGDLNLDAWTNEFNSGADDRSGLEELIFEVEDQKLKVGETYEVEINAQNFNAIRGLQMTLDYDQSLIDVLDIERGALPDFSEANYNLAFANEGKIPMSWHTDDSPTSNVSTSLFSILIKAKADVKLSEVLAISSSMTKAEAYSSELMNVSLDFTNNGLSVVNNQFELYQNQPNPFKATTTIGFQLPEAGEVTLEIFDVTGKLIYVERGDYAEGYHQIDLDRANLQTGILYYQVSTASDSASKKMIVLD